MDKLFDFSGKVALVTGGSRGLGYEMVKGLAARGADVVIASRKVENCEAVAREVEKMGRKALAVGAHVGSWDGLAKLADAAYDKFGKVDILINNAGMSPLAPSSLETTEDLFNKVIDVNFKGPFRLMALIGSRMVKGKGGSIINISSSGAKRLNSAFAPYAGAKSALNVITKSFAIEYAPKVRVNSIAAGPFLTDISKAWTDEAREKANSALGRPGRPEEIVTAALYLASDASSFTTGTVLEVDGGIL